MSVTLCTQTLPPTVTGKAATGPGWVPVFHLAAHPRVVWWSCWSRWHGLSEPGKTSAPQSVSVAPADHQTRLCDSVPLVFPQVQEHPIQSR